MSIIETPDYLSYQDEQIYYLMYTPIASAKGRVLLANPFASENPHTTLLWGKWAQFIATSGYEVLQFDYRGTGESTGDFEQMGFDDWYQDMKTCLGFMENRYPESPLIIHGLGLGGILGSKIIKERKIDGLIIWSPVQSANKMLYKMLRAKCASDMTMNPKVKRKTRKEYISDLENDKPVEAEGFNWSHKLWQSSFNYNLELPDPNNNDSDFKHITVELNNNDGSLNLKGTLAVQDPTVQAKPKKLCPDLSSLFQSNLDWINRLIDNRRVEN